MARIQKYTTKKVRFLRRSELNGTLSLSQKLSDTTLRLWATFSLCSRIIALIILHLFCSQNPDKLYFLR